MAAFWKRDGAASAFTESLHPAASAELARWIRPRLLEPDLARGIRVGDVVPTGFEAYARIMHPVPTATGSMTWAEVAETTGRVVHARMQWQAIAYPAPDHRLPDTIGEGPLQGVLPVAVASNLIDILSIHTSTPETCSYAIWVGTPGLPRAHATVTAHAGRDYFLFSGDLSAGARAIVVDAHGQPAAPTISANLWWPDDQAWIVVTDVDFRSTIVGASNDAVRQIVEDDTLEAFSVEPDDRADLGGDDHNPLPPTLAHLFS